MRQAGQTRRSPFYALWRRIVFFLVNRIFAGTRAFSVKRRLLSSVGISIGRDTRVVGPLYCTGRLTVGQACWLGRDLRIEGNGEVRIGNGCDIAPDVTFYTGGHELGDRERRAGAGRQFTQTVGDGSWLCARVTVCNEVHIGRGCVVAACACVVSDVADDSMVGGVPARTIRASLDSGGTEAAALQEMSRP